MDQAEISKERRDRELARSGGLRLTGKFITPVVGVTFVPGYPENLHELREAYERPPMPALYPMPGGDMAMDSYLEERERAIDDHFNWSGPEKLPAVLRRNPDNEYDSNAVEVHVPALGDNGMIGHLSRPIAARLAPELDAGTRWLAQVHMVRINFDHMDRPGIDIELARVAEEET